MNVLKIAVVAVLSVAAALVVIGVLIVVAVDVFGDSEFLLDDGAVAEFPYGTTWQPNPLPHCRPTTPPTRRSDDR